MHGILIGNFFSKQELFYLTHIHENRALQPWVYCIGDLLPLQAPVTCHPRCHHTGLVVRCMFYVFIRLQKALIGRQVISGLRTKTTKFWPTDPNAYEWTSRTKRAKIAILGSDLWYDFARGLPVHAPGPLHLSSNTMQTIAAKVSLVRAQLLRSASVRTFVSSASRWQAVPTQKPALQKEFKIYRWVRATALFWHGICI